MDVQSARPSQADRQPPPSKRGFRGKEPIRESVVRISDFLPLWNKLSHIRDHNELYNAALSSVCEVEITAADIERFCHEIKPREHEEGFSWRAGVMLSALINSSVDSDFLIPVDLFNKTICLIGFRNRKNIYVDGDVGEGFAAGMEEGIATVRGNVYGGLAPNLCGGSVIAEQNVYGRVGPYMKGGEITVKGDVGVLGYVHIFETGKASQKVFVGDPMFAVGLGMEGGFISIEGFSGALTGLYQKGGIIRAGYAGSVVGSKRAGGEIYIENDYESISSSPGEGKIFLGTKQLHPKKKNGEDKALSMLLEAWEAIPFDNFDIERSYVEAYELAKVLKYTGDDVANFSRALNFLTGVPHFYTKAGVVLSALINAGEGLFYSVDLRALGGISKLGFRNSKIIRVLGNLGPHAGAESVSGSTMIVEGDVGYAAAAWGSGSMLVSGNAGDFLGLGMRGGYVEVVGSSGNHIGELLEGGSLCIHRKMGTLGNVRSGIVQHGDDILIHRE